MSLSKRGAKEGNKNGFSSNRQPSNRGRTKGSKSWSNMMEDALEEHYKATGVRLDPAVELVWLYNTAKTNFENEQTLGESSKRLFFWFKQSSDLAGKMVDKIIPDRKAVTMETDLKSIPPINIVRSTDDANE